MTKKTVTDDISESEGIRRLRDKAKKMKNSQIVPPIDSDEPAGLLSGGPKSLDLKSGDGSDEPPRR